MKKTVKIYELSACCSTSLVSPESYAEIQRLNTDAEVLNDNDVFFQRIDLARNPQFLIQEPGLNEFVRDKDNSVFPVTLIDGKVVKNSNYPTSTELMEWTGITKVPVISTGKCCG